MSRPSTAFRAQQGPDLRAGGVSRGRPRRACTSFRTRPRMAAGLPFWPYVFRARATDGAIGALHLHFGAEFAQPDPGLHDRVGVERERVDTFRDQPLREVRVVGWSLAADPDVLAALLACLNSGADHELHSGVAFVEAGSDQRRIPVQAKGQLSHVVGPDGESVEVVQEL